MSREHSAVSVPLACRLHFLGMTLVDAWVEKTWVKAFAGLPRSVEHFFLALSTSNPRHPLHFMIFVMKAGEAVD